MSEPIGIAYERVSPDPARRRAKIRAGFDVLRVTHGRLLVRYRGLYGPQSADDTGAPGLPVWMTAKRLDVHLDHVPG